MWCRIQPPMLKDIFFFDSTALSEGRIPLPADSTEKVVMAIQDSSLEFESTGSQELISCKAGTTFLTTLRLVYVPSVGGDFQSFFVPLRRIFSAEDGRIECMCNDNSVGFVYLYFQSSPRTLLYEEIRRLLRTTTMEMIEDNEEDLPYYCEIQE